MLDFKPNSALIAEEDAKRALEDTASTPSVSGLASYVRRCFESAAQARRPIEDRMLECLRRRRGEYSASELAKIKKAGQSEIWMKLTDGKCHAAVAWIEDILLASGEEPWGVKATPEPELPPERMHAIAQQVMQEAMAEFAQGLPVTPEAVRDRARQVRDEVMERMVADAKRDEEMLERRIKDVLVEGGFREAFKAFLDNMVTFPCGFLKGPVWEMRPSMAWQPDGTAKVVDKPCLRWKAPSPLDIFPAPLSVGCDDSYLCERHALTRRDLAALKGITGYDNEAIDQALDDYGRGGLREWDILVDTSRRNELEDKSNTVTDPEGRICAVQFWGYVQGQQLIDFGVSDEMVQDPLADYAAEVWIVGRHVIKAELNGDGLGRRPYYKASFRTRPGSFWGEGLPEVIADCQDMANDAARALANNQAIASGPQVGVDVGQFAEGEVLTEMFPWKLWQFDMSRNTTSRPPMWFFQPQSLVQELLRVYEFFSGEADEKSGIPRYLSGDNPTGGAAGTATGLSILQGNASKSIKRVIGGIDTNVTEPAVQRTFEILLESGLLPTYQGDVKIIARGASALVAKEQAMLRRNEFLQIVNASPLIQEIMGLPGIADLLRAHVRDLAIGADDAIPSGEDIRRKQQILAAQQHRMPLPPGQDQPGQPGQPAQAQGGQPQNPAAAMPDGSPPSGSMVAQFNRPPMRPDLPQGGPPR